VKVKTRAKTIVISGLVVIGPMSMPCVPQAATRITARRMPGKVSSASIRRITISSKSEPWK